MADKFDAPHFLKNITSKPGIYRMLDAEQVVIYVGKAKNLKKRLTSYFRKRVDNPKTRLLVTQIANIEVVVTHTEGEALLLENNLIKELKPRYNILLRDDKSYPSIFLSAHDDFPRLGYHRGVKRAKGRYFGPYPSAGSVRESLNLLQKIFPVRQCEDTFYRSRTRPCLQYQIKRCTAPCVGFVTKEAYAKDINHAVMFLEGKNEQVINDLVACMEVASNSLAFEKAGDYRDQIANLRRVQEKQYVSNEGGDLDVVACAVEKGLACVQVFFIRGGRNLGNKSFFPKQTQHATPSEVLGAFLPQYYLAAHHAKGGIPKRILLNHPLDEMGWLAKLLGEQAGYAVQLSTEVRSERRRWLEMATNNARVALRSQITSKANMRQRYEALQDALQLDAIPQRMECFDISHTMGEGTVASCVVFDGQGPVKSDYRRFNIKDITGGDDYAAMRQALLRRYTRLKKGEGAMPDILFVDGGKGQLSQAEGVLEELQINGVLLVGVAKGVSRKPGEESLFLSASSSPFILAADSPALHLIQQIRDEAHRFAITGHRARRAKIRNVSPLEGIAGLGPKRRQQLLKHFGGIQEIKRVGVEDLAKLSGISTELAQRIYDQFHQDDV
ncbi:MAG: excinuclease ABC subunit UvrC [Gammaproteobacteria bacterium]|nr:excinuclease ABC subunit UvrC [Gammaproteobacteria bacterium]